MHDCQFWRWIFELRYRQTLRSNGGATAPNWAQINRRRAAPLEPPHHYWTWINHTCRLFLGLGSLSIIYFFHTFPFNFYIQPSKNLDKSSSWCRLLVFEPLISDYGTYNLLIWEKARTNGTVKGSPVMYLQFKNIHVTSRLGITIIHADINTFVEYTLKISRTRFPLYIYTNSI